MNFRRQRELLGVDQSPLNNMAHDFPQRSIVAVDDILHAASTRKDFTFKILRRDDFAAWLFNNFSVVKTANARLKRPSFAGSASSTCYKAPSLLNPGVLVSEGIDGTIGRPG